MAESTQQPAAAPDQDVPQPRQDGRGADDPGPRNVVLDRQNPAMLTPPVLVQAHLHLNGAAMGTLRKHKEPVVKP